MTKEEFIEDYCLKSNITKELFNENFIVKPCDCGEEICEGYKAVNKKITVIKLDELKDLISYNTAIFPKSLLYLIKQYNQIENFMLLHRGLK